MFFINRIPFKLLDILEKMGIISEKQSKNDPVLIHFILFLGDKSPHIRGYVYFKILYAAVKDSSINNTGLRDFVVGQF